MLNMKKSVYPTTSHELSHGLSLFESQLRKCLGRRLTIKSTTPQGSLGLTPRSSSLSTSLACASGCLSGKPRWLYATCPPSADEQLKKRVVISACLRLFFYSVRNALSGEEYAQNYACLEVQSRAKSCSIPTSSNRFSTPQLRKPRTPKAQTGDLSATDL